MRLLAGTSGFSYAEWKGPFYPDDLPASGMLAFYASRLPAVEINNTFYRMPKRETLAAWAEAVPAGFGFVLKASRRITHFKKLRDTAGDVEYLLGAAAALGEHLGPILFQLPPFLKRDLDLLRDFLAALPPGTRAALETRHDSWDEEPVHDLLRDHGVAFVANDGRGEGEEGDPSPPEPHLLATAPFAYLRLRRPEYDDAALTRWAERLAAGGWQEAWVFFKHEDAGAGPRLAQRFLELATEPLAP